MTPEEADILVAKMREPKRALIVDDNEDLLTAVSAKMEQMGILATTARTPEEGILAFESGDFDLCIVDLVFPRDSSALDGIDLIKHIRGKNATVPPVILLTGYPQHERIKAIGEIPGPVTVIPKSALGLDLANMLLRFVGGAVYA